jgi:anti-sigma regulatory factor (Ser/Thr protein kinase)
MGTDKIVSTPDEHFEITAHPQNAATARERIRRVATTAGLSRSELDDLEIAVGEAVTNAILYGSPSATSRIVVSCGYDVTTHIFHVEVKDQGRGFDPDHIRQENNTDMLGGRGIRLMRALMDEVVLQYTGSGMAVRLSKHHV